MMHRGRVSTPDLMSIILVLAIQAKGQCADSSKMFESRLFFVDKLIDMGAQIIFMRSTPGLPSSGSIRSYHLRGIEMSSPDIRGRSSLIIDRMSAKGTSLIHNVHQIDRGYQKH
jgi:UDP-N-acetylglucosamine 1-carboxyvinyltransferase